jgi:hypothetical protein
MGRYISTVETLEKHLSSYECKIVFFLFYSNLAKRSNKFIHPTQRANELNEGVEKWRDTDRWIGKKWVVGIVLLLRNHFLTPAGYNQTNMELCDTFPETN